MKTVPFYMILVCCLVLSQHQLRAQVFANGYWGTEFMFSLPPANASIADSAMIYLHCTAGTSCLVKVDIGGTSLGSYSLSPLIEKVIAINPRKSLFYWKNGNPGLYGDQAFIAQGIHVSSTAQISLSCQLSHRVASESFHVLPVNQLGSTYLVSTSCPGDYRTETHYSTSVTTICATQDETDIEIYVGGDLSTSTISHLKLGSTLNIHLNAGDVYILSADTIIMNATLSGTRVRASKPVAVVSGTTGQDISVATGFALNYTVEMELPTSKWGKTYLIPLLKVSDSYWQTFGFNVYPGQTNTVFHVDDKVGSLSQMGGRPMMGYYPYVLEKGGPQLHVVQSDQLISVCAFNTHLSDSIPVEPFSLVVQPVENFVKQTLISFDASDSSGFITNRIGLVVPVDSALQLPSSLVLTKIVNGTVEQSTVAGNYVKSVPSYSIYSAVTGKQRYAYVEFSIKGTAVIGLNCDLPFMAYAYGHRAHASYAYAASMLGQTSKLVDSVAPLLLHRMENMTFIGSAHDMPDDSAHRSNMASIYLKSGAYNVRLESDTIADHSHRDMSWKLHIIDSTKDAYGIVVASDWASNISSDTLRYSAIESLRPNVVVSPHDTTCVGMPVTMSTRFGTYVGYRWQNGDTTAVVIRVFSKPGTYEVYVDCRTPEQQQLRSDTVKIVVVDVPEEPVIVHQHDSLVTKLQPGHIYNWFFENGALCSGFEMNRIELNADGRYRVRVTVPNADCFAESKEVLMTRVSVDEASDAIRPYPQPARDHVSLELPDEKILIVEFTTTTGQAVYPLVEGVQSSAVRVDLQQLSVGMYTMRVVTSSCSRVYSVLKY